MMFFDEYHHPLEPPLPPITPHCEQKDDTFNATTDNTIALYPLPPVSMHQGEDDQVMATTSDAITNLATQLIDQLDTRAKALANGAQFDLALRDAAMVRALSPTSALGYLRAGSVYQQQGHQQAAVSIYKQGLKVVAPTDPGYTELETSCAAALDAQAKVIDFVSELPHDIVSMKIVPLLFDKLEEYKICPYLYVSSTWHNRILANNALHLRMFQERNILVFPEYDMLRYTRHYKSLSIHHRHDWARILKEKPWPRLTHLDIDCK